MKAAVLFLFGRKTHLDVSVPSVLMADVCSAVDRHEAQDIDGQHHAVATNVMVANTKKCFLSAGSLNQNSWCKETENSLVF